MTVIGWIQILLQCAIVVALVVPLGGYMAHVFNGERTFLSPILRPVEAVCIGSAASPTGASSTGSPTRYPCCSFASADF